MLLDNNKKQQAENKWQTFFERLYLVVFNFFIQKIIHDKIILFEVALLVQKTMMRTGYDEQSVKQL